MRKIIIALGVAAGFSAAPCLAQSWYADLGVGQAKIKSSALDLGLSSQSIDTKETVYGVGLGYRFNPYIAVEGDYYNLGKYSVSGRVGTVDVSGSTKASSLGVSVVGTLPIAEVFELYGRVGYARSELKASASAAGISASDKGHENEAYYGFGGRYMFSKTMGAFVQWTQHDKLELDHWMAGLQFRF